MICAREFGSKETFFRQNNDGNEQEHYRYKMITNPSIQVKTGREIENRRQHQITKTVNISSVIFKIRERKTAQNVY